jgi:hypothetical protein
MANFSTSDRSLRNRLPMLGCVGLQCRLLESPRGGVGDFSLYSAVEMRSRKIPGRFDKLGDLVLTADFSTTAEC